MTNTARRNPKLGPLKNQEFEKYQELCKQKILNTEKDKLENELKQNVRKEALRAAKYIKSNNTSKKVLKDADKIYQWLIKDLK